MRGRTPKCPEAALCGCTGKKCLLIFEIDPCSYSPKYNKAIMLGNFSNKTNIRSSGEQLQTCQY